MKVYLAGRFERRADLAEVGAVLKTLGHTIVSRWLTGTHDLPTGGWETLTPKEADRFASEDLEDIQACDVFVLFSESGSHPRGGRHVEFGYALALRKAIVVVGPRENIFHHLPEIDWVDLSELGQILRDYAAALSELSEPEQTGTDRRRAVLKSVEDCVCQDRQNTYGDAEDNFAVIAQIANAYLGDRIEPPLTALDIAALMLAVKLARLKTSPLHLDNWVDAAGYAVCGAGIAKTL